MTIKNALPAMNIPVPSVAPECQVKTLTLSYTDFCLLISVVAAQANSDKDATGEWKRLYVRLGGSL